MKRFSVYFSLLLAAALGCGKQIDSPTLAVTFGPPRSLKALSLNSSTVTLHWSPGIGDTDPSFLGYIVSYNGLEDSIPKTNLGYVADSLLPGITAFSVYSYQSDGPRSNATNITWAPAARFDNPVVIEEYFVQDTQRVSGLNVGSQTTDPTSLTINLADSMVLRTLDVYLYGGVGFSSDTLKLHSGHLFRTDLPRTFFSTLSDSASSLDLPISFFPGEETFTRDSVVVGENRIFYLKITGDSRLDTLYARIHVRLVPGFFFPNRKIEVRVSLQRVPGIPFAWLPSNQPPPVEDRGKSRRFVFLHETELT